VQISAPRIRQGRCQAILVNSGNANACTGEQGRQDALRCGALAAAALGIDEDLVAVSSTGVIGAPLPMAKFEEQVPKLAAQLREDHADEVAAAIMTTDSFAKRYVVTGEVDGRPYRILGVAKGAGGFAGEAGTCAAGRSSTALAAGSGAGLASGISGGGSRRSTALRSPLPSMRS